ncbi:MAG: hypothetical protein GF349_00985 [Candidatus Magasanikbacteria bacterium]|nr:hypothetical protein [Candidatus Magasanikbacteria bacterium]
MTPRRHETKIPGNQPIRFYKIVALTFLLLTIGLFAVIIFMSSKEAEIIVTTKSSAIEINRQLEIGESSAPNSIDGIVTSTEITITEKFSPSGEKEELGKAGGVVTIHNESSSNQILVATTRLLTPEGVLFRLDDRVSIPAGSTVEAVAHADQEGEIGEVGPVERFSIPGLSESSQKFIYATSNEAMTGGVKQVGVLSAEDIRKAEKILSDKVESRAEEEFAKLFPNKNFIVSISNIKQVQSDVEVGEKVSEFNVTLVAEVAGVFYEAEDLETWAVSMLMKRAIDQSEIIEASEDPPTVILESLDNKKAVVNVVYTGLASLNPEGKQLQKSIFFGKTKDEARRYLLSLDHVHSAEVKFKPAWMRTIPHVSDKVTIVIKKVD